MALSKIISIHSRMAVRIGGPILGSLYEGFCYPGSISRAPAYWKIRCLDALLPSTVERLSTIDCSLMARFGSQESL